ncbi:amidohydrolase [Pseudoclavibacter endophyticus]|uniref:Amidohydrolase n=1 Tax=Pseudoclavibacter endophyticus TaxID=1778590 RepID=A0A6H9WNC1_9MICO|nr:amidohydrolase [Pseudoclavibacter endophyticus]KAB1648258.1 amidohydrolase [Pseudoclavibacter endophyticus]GGA71104.1 amidohydrolase [Pseudoclavibacter endophyticus]
MTPFPDLVVTGGQVWDPERTDATAVAIRDGRIAAVGPDAEILAAASPSTRRLDAEGGAIVPGFHDAHVHAVAAGLALLGCDLSDAHDVDGYAHIIRRFAAGTDDEWIVGAGWFGDAFPGGLPHRRLLDELVPDRPAVLTSHDAHGVWVNSRALERARITDDTADPPAGRVVRDASGRATGVLFDAAGELVTRLIPRPDAQRHRDALLAAQERLLSFGITSWHDAIVGEYLTIADPLPTYLEALADGSLRARVTGSIWWPADRGAADAPEILERVHSARAAGFEATGVKIMQDGICENCTAALLEPYRDVHPLTSGDSVIAPGELAEIVTAVDNAGLRVHFHGVGDRAVRECLDAVETARQRNGQGQRHQIAHLDLVSPEDIPRFAELGVTANLQPLWARADQEILERKLPLIGEDRARWHFPFGSLRAARAHLAMGSDWPVTSPDPLWGLYTACTRTAPPDDVHALNTESRETMNVAERLDLATALRAYTQGSAEVIGAQDSVGRLTPGHLADIAILTGPLSDAGSLAEVRVAHTLVGGDVLYSR